MNRWFHLILKDTKFDILTLYFNSIVAALKQNTLRKEKHWVQSGILRDKTMVDKFMNIPNDNKHIIPVN